MTPATPRVSVIVATRDRPTAVTTAVASVLRQTQPVIELVVADQSGDGATEAALEPFAGDARLRHLRIASTGCSAARNRAIREARARILFIMDDDCELSPDTIPALLEGLERFPTAGIVFGSVLPGPHDASLGCVPACVQPTTQLARGILDKHRVEGLSAAMGILRSVWEELSGFDEMLGAGAPLQSGAETDFTLRALLQGVHVLALPSLTITHHGFRSWPESIPLARRYWFGTGATFAKLLRRGHVSILVLLLRLGMRFAREQSPVAKSLRGSATRRVRLASFVRGFGAGLTRRIDSRSQHFVPR